MTEAEIVLRGVQAYDILRQDNKVRLVGLDVVYGHLQKGVSLVSESISDGPFSKWNQDHPEACVQRLDRIVGVNGCTGGPRKLKVALRGMGVLEVTIPDPKAVTLCRPPGQEASSALRIFATRRRALLVSSRLNTSVSEGCGHKKQM